MKTMFDLTGFQRDVLIIIDGLDDPSGQDIKKEYEERSGEEITHGRLYPNLNTLVEKGYVRKENLESRTNTYKVTGEGRKMHNSHVQWQQDYLMSPEPQLGKKA